MTIKRFIPVLILNLFIFTFTSGLFAQNPISHHFFDALLRKHVGADGSVDYQGFIKDNTIFQNYLQLLRDNPPKESWPKKDQMAYWINAFNAFTIDQILKIYPLHDNKVKQNLFDSEVITIDSESLSLNEIRDKKLWEGFKDQEIYFALCQATVSSPPLRNEAYTGTMIAMQLSDQTKKFLNNKNNNKYFDVQIKVSMLFHWYEKSFTDQNGIVSFINNFLENKISDSAEVAFLEYDWTLNDRSIRKR